jgi:outer membrane protein insertion porin family
MSRERLGRVWLVGMLLATIVRAEDSAQTFVGVVRFDGPPSIDRTDYLAQIPLREGAPFSQATLDQSVAWLEEKKIFASVRAERDAHGTTVDVTFVLEPLPFVVELQVSDRSHVIAEETLLRRARIREDEVLTSERLEAGKRRVVALYAERGYPQAQVTTFVEPVEPGQAKVRLDIDPGSPVRLARIDFEGLDPTIAAEARTQIALSPGDVVPSGMLAATRKTLLAWLRRQGYYEAEIIGSESFEGDNRSLHFDVRLGPRYEIVVVGNLRLTRADLLDVGDLANRPIVTHGTWQMMALRMKERYAERGYAFAEVNAAIEEGEPRVVRFTIHEGAQVQVRDVRVQGNRALDRPEVLSLLRVRPSGWRDFFGPDPTLYRPDVFTTDLEAVQAHYRELGYFDAKVEEGEPEVSADGAAVVLTLTIAEGPQRIVRSVAIDGVPPAAEVTEADLATRAGQPYRDVDVESDNRLLKKKLGALGYADGRVSTEVSAAVVDESGNRASVDVRYRVEAGSPVHIGHVIIQRNYFTRDSVVRGSLPFDSGDPLDPDALARAQTDLLRLGLFRSASVRPLEQSGPVRDVVVEIGERPNGELFAGYGYDTSAGFRHFLQIGHNNVAGTGRRLAFRGGFNLRPKDFVPDEWIVSLDGKEPYFLDSRTALRATTTYQQSERNIDEFSQRSFSAALGPEREFFRGLRASYLAEFEDSDVFDVAPDAVLTGQDVGRHRTVSMNPLIVYDGRDDPFKPTRGVFESLRLRYAAPGFGSDTHFFKVVGQHSQYIPLGALTALYAGRVGYGLPIGITEQIPLRERFFLGGRTSVRGYNENEIGPRGDNGDPIGGDFLVNFNTELRFPLFLGLRGAVFLDGGGDYLVDQAISFHEFREGAGPGLRYQTPVGTIALDYGFKIDRRAGESIGEVHFTIGNIF